MSPDLYKIDKKFKLEKCMFLKELKFIHFLKKKNPHKIYTWAFTYEKFLKIDLPAEMKVKWYVKHQYIQKRL